MSKLERRFRVDVHDDSLKPLCEVIKGLMRLLPSDRMSLSRALQLVERQSQTGSERQPGKSKNAKGHDGKGTSEKGTTERGMREKGGMKEAGWKGQNEKGR